MKNKLVILFLLVSLIVKGQSVPNTTTFSLQDVENAISGTQGNLQQCFTDAIPCNFNPTYNNSEYAPANSLLRFRDYGTSCPSVSTYAYGGTLGGTSFSVSTPSAVAGDILLIIAASIGNSGLSAPSGWSTSFTQVAPNSTTIAGAVYYKVITSTTSSGSATVGATTSSNKYGYCIKLTGASCGISNYTSFSSSTTYSSRTGGNISGAGGQVNLYMTVLIGGTNAPNQNLGTGWSWGTGESTSSFGGWGFGMSSYCYSSSSTSTTTSFNFNSTYLWELGVLIY